MKITQNLSFTILSLLLCGSLTAGTLSPLAELMAPHSLFQTLDIKGLLTVNDIKTLAKITDLCYHGDDGENNDVYLYIHTDKKELYERLLQAAFEKLVSAPKRTASYTVTVLQKVNPVDFVRDKETNGVYVHYRMKGADLCVALTNEKKQKGNMDLIFEHASITGKHCKHRFAILAWDRAMFLKRKSERIHAQKRKKLLLKAKPDVKKARKMASVVKQKKLPSLPFGKYLETAEKQRLFNLIRSAHSKFKKNYGKSSSIKKRDKRYELILKRLKPEGFFFRVLANPDKSNDYFWFLDEKGKDYIVSVSNNDVSVLENPLTHFLDVSEIAKFTKLEKILGKELYEIYAHSAKNPYPRLNILAEWVEQRNIQTLSEARPLLKIVFSSSPERRIHYFDRFLNLEIGEEAALFLATADNPTVAEEIYFKSIELGYSSKQARQLANQNNAQLRFEVLNILLKNEQAINAVYQTVITMPVKTLKSIKGKTAKKQKKKIKNQKKKKESKSITRRHKRYKLKEVERKRDEELRASSSGSIELPEVSDAGALVIDDIQILVLKQNRYVDFNKLLHEFSKRVISKLQEFILYPDSPAYYQTIKNIKRIRIGSERLYIRFYPEEKILIIVGFENAGTLKRNNSRLLKIEVINYLTELGEMDNWNNFYSLEMIQWGESGRLQAVPLLRPKIESASHSNEAPISDIYEFEKSI